jgi:hypothetical protein
MTTLALITWPLFTLVLVLRLPFPKAVLISMLGGFLLLPVEGGWNLPLLPPFKKDTIPALTLLVLALLLYRGPRQAGGSLTEDRSVDMPGWIPRSVFAFFGLSMIVLGSQMTALTNGDRLVYGPTVIPGLRPYDGLSLALAGLTTLVPLLLGRKFFAHPESHALLLRGLVVGGMAYSLLALYEIRMSPQLSSMVYGFFPHDWRQHFRAGGWRPIVFMEHGLQLTLFLASVTLAAFGASRCLEARRRPLYLIAGVWLLVTLFLSNSLGALIIAIAFLPAMLFLGIRMQVLFAATIAAIILLYPMLRSVDVIPTERFVSVAETIDPARARSLNFRFQNEDRLLEHARERPLFGWGTWSRNRVFNENGQDISVTDGAWVIVMGVGGWTGYLAQFGFLALPVILLAVNRRRYEVSSVTSVLALVLAASLVDLIPNGFLSPITLLMSGALWGRLELGALRQEGNAQVAKPQAPYGHLAYARSLPRRGDPEPSEASSANVAEEGRAYTRQTSRHMRSSHSR